MSLGCDANERPLTSAGSLGQEKFFPKGSEMPKIQVLPDIVRLLSPIVRTSRAQRLSSTAVYPPCRPGTILPDSQLVAGRHGGYIG